MPHFSSFGTAILEGNPDNELSDDTTFDTAAHSTPFHFNTTHFNPETPVFYPQGTELQRYQYHPTPPTSNMSTSGELKLALHRYVAENHVQHTQDVSRITVQTRKNTEEISDIKDTVRNDLRQLQDQLHDMQLQLARQEDVQIVAMAEPGPDEFRQLEFPSLQDMSERFSKVTISMVFREQVEVLEEAAERLKRDIRQLDGPAQQVLTNGIGYYDTPTHAPARRAHRDIVQHESTDSEVSSESNETTSPEESETAAMQPTQLRKVAVDGVAMSSSATAEIDWMPLAVRNMPPSTFTGMVKVHPETFTLETFTLRTLQKVFGGKEWSPGYYYIPQATKLRSKAYWILDAGTEPFLPKSPGEHGAKLTAFFNTTVSEVGQCPDEENYKDCPVFVKLGGSNRFTYFGQYSQLRFSDKLDYDTMMNGVPEHVRQHWAESLVSAERPEWVTKALMVHFWPKPTYEGPMPTDSDANSPSTEDTTKAQQAHEKRVTKSLQAYAQELKAWEKHARINVNFLSADGLMKSFEAADADIEPGLRLWWEYFQCVGYDHDFYMMLCQFKSLERFRLANKRAKKARAEFMAKPTTSKTSSEATASPPQEASGKTVPASTNIETDQPVSPQTEKPMIIGADIWSDWDNLPPKPRREHPYFPTTNAEPVTQTAPKSTTQQPGFPKGDIEAAKKFQQSATKAGAGYRGSGGGKRVPPHRR